MKSADETKNPEEKRIKANSANKFGQKIGSSVWDMSEGFVTGGKKERDNAKASVKTYAANAEKDVEESKQSDESIKKVKKISTIATTTLVIGILAFGGIIYWTVKKYGK
jgi:hypothetical protein